MHLETLLQRDAKHEITHIFTRNHLTFFKLHGESFCVGANCVYHQSDYRYDHFISQNRAKEAHDPETQVRHQKMMENVHHEVELWEKHRESVMKLVFATAVNILVEKGEKEFMKFVDHHLEISPERGARTIISRLEKE